MFNDRLRQVRPITGKSPVQVATGNVAEGFCRAYLVSEMNDFNGGPVLIMQTAGVELRGPNFPILGNILDAIGKPWNSATKVKSLARSTSVRIEKQLLNLLLIVIVMRIC